MSDLIRKILVPTDFSEAADAAVNTAANFARKLNAKLILLHVVDIPEYGGFHLKDDLQGTSLEEIACNAAQTRLNRLKLSPNFKGINLQVKIIIGKAYRTILDESQLKTDLIVMSTHGFSGIDKLLMGSTAQKVVQLSAVPVLTIKEYLGIDKIKNIVFASSFNQEYSFSFPVLYQFMELFKAKLHLLKVITPRDFEPTYYSKRTIEDFASEFLLRDYQLQIVNDHTIEEGIEWFCNENKIDIVFMTTHGRKGLPHLLSGSHTEKTGQKYSFPVFSIKMIKVKTPKGVIFPD